MLYIIEGPDGSGKTTMANSIASAYGAQIIHNSNPKTEEEGAAMFSMYLRTILGLDVNKSYVFDRCWYSEMVYGPILRGRSQISIDQMDMLEEALRTQGIQTEIIHCNDDIALLWKRCKERGETFIKDIVTLSFISEGFTELLDNQKHLFVVVKYGISTL